MGDELQTAQAEDRDKEVKNLPDKPGEPPKQPIKMTDFSDQIERLMPLVGTIELTRDEMAILYAPVDPELVEIRPDGMVYLPWMQYIMRLRKALGISWGLIPMGMPRTKGEMILWPFWFIIRGIPVSFCIGEQLWSSTNQRMSWSEATEGARSNALMRACKAIGICLELWDPAFIRKWIAKYAKQVPNPNPKKKGEMMWVKITDEEIAMAGKEKRKEPIKIEEYSTPLTMEQAVEKTIETFPGAEVVDGAIDANQKPLGATGLAEDIEKTPSATLFVKYHDEMVRLAHYEILRDWWGKHNEEAEQKLNPNHWKMLVELKNKLRQGFIDKAKKEKGGK